MNTETIDLNIGGVDFSQCIVDFEYEPADKGSPVQPPYDEDVTVYRVQFDISECEGFVGPLWCDLQSIHFHLLSHQILEWIHDKQDADKAERAVSSYEQRMFTAFDAFIINRDES